MNEVSVVNKRRKVPMRKCIATGEMKPKKELIRIVRSKEGEVSIDPTGKKSGRGAYLSVNKDAILLAKQKDVLASQFKMKIDHSIYDKLLEMVEEKTEK